MYTKNRQTMKDTKNTQKMKYTKPQILQMPCPSLFSCPFQFQAGKLSVCSQLYRGFRHYRKWHDSICKLINLLLSSCFVNK